MDLLIMNIAIVTFIVGLVLITSVLASKIMYRFGVPTLILFLSLGIVLGSEGIGGIPFSDYDFAGTIAQVALIVIIFSGGFDTVLRRGEKSLPLAISLSSFGTILTALLVGVFAHFVLNLDWLVGFLLGSIIASTDAASVFSILRSKQLNLKSDLATTLEVESGSNDPFAYLLTILFLSLLQGTGTNIVGLIFFQLVVGAIIGIGVGWLAVVFINRINLLIDGLYIVIAVSMMALSFGLSTLLFGNGYLSVYLTGLFMANKPLTHKISLVRFFDGLTWLMQILLFFTLGLLVFPSQVIAVIGEGILIALFLSFVARPIAVFTIMTIFKKPIQEKLLLSWVGFRGAASIVFAIFVISSNLPNTLSFYLFNIVFFVAIFSVLLQGTTMSKLAQYLGLIDKEESVLTTFSDYRGDTYAELLHFHVQAQSSLVGKLIRDIDIPPHLLIVMIKRKQAVITPKASTMIQAKDILLLASDDKKELLAFAKGKKLNLKKEA
jgi:potassium/hydrogen antiporter